MAPKRNNQIRVVVADDHTFFRKGIITEINKNRSIEVIAEACNGLELVQCARLLKPDVIITDIQMPHHSGIEAMNILKKENLKSKFIILSFFEDEIMMEQCIAAGALGYFSKTLEVGELCRAIKEIHETGLAYTFPVASNKFGRKTNVDIRVDPFNNLTSFELSLIRLICQDLSDEEIASAMGASIHRINRMKERLKAKLSATSDEAIKTFADKHKLGGY